DDGFPVIRSLTEDRMRHVLGRVAYWYAIRETKDGDYQRTPALPPLHVVKDVLATPNAPLPILSRIVEAPVFAPDGTLQLEPGYHPAAQTFYAADPELVIPPVPEAPTPEDVASARQLLAGELLGEFPFTGPAELAHALALLLLPFVR